MSSPFIIPIASNGWYNVDAQGNTIGIRTPGSGPLIDIIPASRDIRPGSSRKKSVADKALDEAKKQGNKALEYGKEALKKGIDSALKSNPATAPFAIGADIAGVNPFGGGGKSWLEQLQEWIKETGIFQRLALAILAFIFIAVALAMLGRNSITGNVAQIVKGTLK